MFYVEIRSSVRRSGPPMLVPLEDVSKHTGFRSVCAFDEATADLIRENGGTAGLRHIPVYADTLFIDFDNVEPTEFRTWLRGSGLGFEEYDSGGRSVHFHIPMNPIYGSWVPEAMKQWTKAHAKNADVSFLHAAGMYRLPGTFHYKYPGRCKTLVHSQPGQALQLSAPPPKIAHFSLEEDGDPQKFFTMLTASKGAGQRSRYIWQLATVAAEAGIEFDKALENIRWWNEKFANPPQGEDLIMTQCTKAYQRVASK